MAFETFGIFTHTSMIAANHSFYRIVVLAKIE